MLSNLFLIVDVDSSAASKPLPGATIAIAMSSIRSAIFKAPPFNVYPPITEEYDKENGSKNALNDLNLTKSV